MKERPILFSAPMVRALLAGTKTQTRRVVTDHNSRGNYRASELLLDDKRAFADPGPSPAGNPGWYLHAPVNAPAREKRMGWSSVECDPSIVERLYPWVFAGDRLWVRETFAKIDGQTQPWIETDYRATYTHGDRLGDTLGIKKRWTPAIHMPRAASRISLEVTSVRVERLHEISEEDSRQEGVESLIGERFDIGCSTCRDRFQVLWQSINGGASWSGNPWVWVVGFRLISPATR